MILHRDSYELTDSNSAQTLYGTPAEKLSE